MQKDVIYIDVEDDITAIIDKVKKSKEKVVALVPPKRIGVLQSAVNLRLLSRTAGNANKHLVLITGNAALSGLAASAKIPVAKNLQSKPELAQIPALKIDDDDVINGEELPARDHADSVEASSAIPVSKIEGIDIDGEAASKTAPTRTKSAKKGIKVPDFGTFRKKALIFGGLGVFLVVFLVWAIVFAPRATIVVSAETSDQDLSMAIAVGPDLQTDFAKEQLKGIRQEDKATQTIEFDATGTKDVGEKATGEVVLATTDFSVAASGTTVPAGTVLSTSGGLLFTTTQSATFALQPGGNQRTVGVVASASGTQYNGFSGNLSGAPSGVSAKINNATSGGTTKEIKVVTQADINKATVELTEQNTDEAKKKLIAKFEPGTVVIDSSFKANTADPQSSPALGQEATAKAKLTQETTYTVMGVAKAQISSYLDEALQKRISNKDEQKVYDNGVSTIKFADFVQNAGEQKGTVNVTAVAQIGPKIDDNEVKEQVKGKRTGEIMGDLKSIDGVSDVEVKLSPFWVQGVPDDIKKITVEFKLKKND